MSTSLFLAKLMGPALLIVGLGALLNRPDYRATAKGFVASPPLFYLAAVMGVVIGLAIILVHNVWVADWRVLITLIGWTSLARGAARILFPQPVVGLVNRMVASDSVILGSGAVTAILGAVFSYFGYLA